MKKIISILVLLLAWPVMARAAAPVITSIYVTATTPTSGTITWTTDIPSTSMLQYGTTSAIPYQTNVNYTLTTTHSMTLPLLTAGPLYYVAAVSGDNAGNNTQSATITFSVCGSPTIPVSGTVNNYYEYGSFRLTWIPPAGASGTPTACGVPITQSVAGNLSGSASFTTAVADASKVVPGPGQWEIQATDAGNLAPITTYAYLAQSSQDVSPALQLAASTAGLTACIINTLSGVTYPTDCGGGQLTLEHNGTPLVDQKLLNFNDTTPPPPGGNVNVTFQTDAFGNLSGYIPTGGIGGCPENICIQNNPSATQYLVQPPTTNLEVNNFNGQVWADQYGTGSNGIETAYTQCLAQNGQGYSGCSIFVAQNYTNADAPSGWSFNSSAYSNPPMQLPSGGAVYDQRNGTEYRLYHNPLNPITGQGTGLAITTQWDINTANSNAVVGGPNRTGIYNLVNVLNGGSEFNYYISGIPEYLTETYTYGDYTTLNNYIGGINFLHYGYENCRSNGDCYGDWRLITADAGILSGASEGDANADYGVREDPDVFTGTISGTPATGATQVFVNATIGAGTQGGMYRWLVNQSTPLATGTQFSGTVSELTTGSAGNSAVMPPQVSDSTQNFPVSTMLQICYSGSDNGASGATGCTSGSQPVGYIPSQNYKFTITSGSISGGVASFNITPTSPQTTPVHLVAGQQVMLYGFSLTGAAPLLNQQMVTVSATGLSTTTFQANVTNYTTVAATGSGYSTYSPTGYSPAQAITVGIVPAYTTGGGTGGLPAGFCTPGTVQTSNPSASCYLPTSGVACITDQIETECQNYTYNSGTQQITITNLQFPHLNGAVFAVGGLAGKTIEDLSSQYTSGGTSGIIDEVYPVAGSLNSTTLYYVPQRTNLGYASPPLGGSTDGGSDNGGVNNSQQTALCFTASMSNFTNNSGVISFSMGFVAGTNGGQYPDYNGRTVTISGTGNSTYNGSYPLTFVSGGNFTYTPTSPSGSVPSTGTVASCNANYKILDAARIMTVLNPSNSAVDGTFNLFPNTASLAGATVRSPHFQQISINGTHLTETQFQPKTFNGVSSDTLTYQGNISGGGWGLVIDNESNPNVYLGGGGTILPPNGPLGLYGVWQDTLQITAPQQSIIAVQGYNLFGSSSANSAFGIIQFPAISGAFSGFSIDTLCYFPAYNLSGRGSALTSGEYIFGNVLGAGCTAGPASGNMVSTVRMGHLIADLTGSISELTSNDVTVVAITNFLQNAASVVNTPGSTGYNYEIVAHDKNGGSTIPTYVGQAPYSVPNGNATLNTSNYNRICAFVNPGVFSYDFLKQVGGVYQSMATNVAVGNGSSFGVVPNYTCWNDQGGTTSSYAVPTQNTTGSVFANSVDATFMTALTSVTAPNIYATNLTVGNCVQAAAGGLLVTTSSPCGSGGGGGMVYPPAGVGNSTGSAWSTSYQVGTAANDLVQLDGSGNMPAVSAAAMTGYLYSNLAGSGIVPIANGGTGTTTPGLTGGTGISVTGTWPNQTIAATGGSGFPFTLGSTSITGGSTTTAVTGLSVNNVTLVSGGSTAIFLNQFGTYTTPAGLTSFAAPSGSWPTWLVPTVTNATSTPSLAVAASTIPVSAGGTGTTTPSLLAGAGIAITGSWPGQTVSLAIPDVSVSVPSFSIPPTTCYGSTGSTTPATVTMTGVTTSPITAIVPSYSANSSAIVGWGTAGGLNFQAWASASNTVSYLICNPTGTSITGGAITFILAAR